MYYNSTLSDTGKMAHSRNLFLKQRPLAVIRDRCLSVGVRSERCLSMGSDKALTDSGYLSTSSRLNIGEPQQRIFESTSSVNNTRLNTGSQSSIYSKNETPKRNAHDYTDNSLNTKEHKQSNTTKDAIRPRSTSCLLRNTSACVNTSVDVRPRSRTTGCYDENEDMFYPNSPVLKVTKASRPQVATSFWLGCEYKYMFVTEKLKVKFHHTGVLPKEYKDNSKVFIKVTLGEGRNKKTKKVKFGKVGNLKKDKTEIGLSSCADIIKTDLRVNLYIKKGIFSSAKLLGEWSFPIDAPELRWQSKWEHILG